MKRILVIAVALACALGTTIAQDAPKKAIAFKVSKALTMSGAPVDNAVIIVRDGKIDAIGPASETPIPADAEVHDFSDRWAAPGFIDLHCHIGGGETFDINDMVYPTNPGLGTLPTVDPQAEFLKLAVAGGVTTVLYIPGSGTNLGGMGTLMHTGGGDKIEDLVIRFPGAMKVAQAWNPERGGGDLGASRQGMWWNLRQQLDKAKAYHEAWEAFEKGVSKIKPEANPEFDRIRGLFRKEFPVIVHTADARDVMGTIRMFHDDYKLWTIVSHGEFGAHKVSHEAGKRDDLFVNIGPRNFDFSYAYFGYFDYRVTGIANAYYADGGVRNLSLNTDAPVIPEEELQVQGTVSAWLGLPEDVTLKALTIEGAKAVGIADRTGSLEKGKRADIVLWTGDPLDVRNYVVLTMIEGKVVYDLRKDERRW